MDEFLWEPQPFRPVPVALAKYLSHVCAVQVYIIYVLANPHILALNEVQMLTFSYLRSS